MSIYLLAIQAYTVGSRIAILARIFSYTLSVEQFQKGGLEAYGYDVIFGLLILR